MHISKAHIYFCILFAFFLYGLGVSGTLDPESTLKIGTAAFSFIAIALILSLYKLWTVRKDAPRRLKMLILVFLLAAMFCYTYVTWCFYCIAGGSIFNSLVSTIFTGSTTMDQNNMITASFAFVTIAFALMLYKIIKKKM